MKLAEFSVEGDTHIGSMIDKGLIDITRFADQTQEQRGPRTLGEALSSWDSSLGWLNRLERLAMESREVDRFLVDPVTTRLAAPVTSPSKILCVFVNYKAHGREVGGAAPSEPIFFFKHANCIVGDGDDVIVPEFSTKPDHEIELGVIIGRRGKNIQARDAYDYVAGYTVINDISFRDGMTRGIAGTSLGRNLFKGKVADTSLPMGPYLVTRDEIPDPYPLMLKLKVNGEQRQNGTTDDMIFKIPDLVESASEGNTLLPGDVISTGTCSGVGLSTGLYLSDGDVVEAEIERVGKLRNTIRARHNPSTQERSGN